MVRRAARNSSVLSDTRTVLQSYRCCTSCKVAVQVAQGQGQACGPKHRNRCRCKAAAGPKSPVAPPATHPLDKGLTHVHVLCVCPNVQVCSTFPQSHTHTHFIDTGGCATLGGCGPAISAQKEHPSWPHNHTHTQTHTHAAVSILTCRPSSSSPQRMRTPPPYATTPYATTPRYVCMYSTVRHRLPQVHRHTLVPSG